MLEILQPHIRTSQTDTTIFCVLLFISLNMFFASIYSIYREIYTLNPTYLKRIRYMSVIITALQISCFVGYWLNIYGLYEISWLLWLSLSTLTIMLMGLKFAESYMILISPNYSLSNGNQIPHKYMLYAFLFWFIGCTVDIAGTVLAFLKYFYLQHICYACWQILCSISFAFVIYILKRLRNICNNIFNTQNVYQKNINYKSNVSSVKVPNVYKLMEDHADDHFNDDISHNNSINKKEHTSTISTTGSINISSFTHASNSTVIIQAEIKRMRNLIYGLYVLVFVFLLNAVFNAVYNFPHHILAFQDNHRHLYTETPTLIVATVIFPQWMAINLFIMMFSWIPKSRMSDT